METKVLKFSHDQVTLQCDLIEEMNRSKCPKIIKLLLCVMLFVSSMGNKKPQELKHPTEDYDGEVFCKKRTRPIRMKADEIYVVDGSVNSSIVLQCKFCEDKDNDMPKTWSIQKHIFTGNITELQTDMEDNTTSSTVFVARDHSLVFRNLQESHMGLYICKAPYVDSSDQSFNYLVDLPEKPDEMRGSMPELKNYSQFYLAEVNRKLLDHTIAFDKTSISMMVYTDWSEWSECDSCLRKEGIRYRVGKCRVKPVCGDSVECIEQRKQYAKQHLVFDDKHNSEPPNYAIKGDIVADVEAVRESILQFGVVLSCNSVLLMKLTPLIYNLTSTVPDFVFSEKCIGSATVKPSKNGPRYRKSIILAKGAHLTLVCPDSTIDSQVRWEHNKRRLNSNEGNDLIPGSTEPRLYVDSFNTLYLFDVTDKESGNFTCFVDGLWMQEVKIIVLTRSLFFTKEFTRHLKYLGFMFLICFAGYFTGVTIMCVKAHSETKKKSKTKTEDCEKLLNSLDESTCYSE